MRAVIYLDSFFMMNILVNTMLLWLFGRLFKMHMRVLRILAAAVSGAALACIWLLFPFCTSVLKNLGVSIAIEGCILCIAFGRQERQQFLYHMACFAALTASMGGVMEMLIWQLDGNKAVISQEGISQQGRPFVGILFMAAAICFLASFFFRCMALQQKKRKCLCSVKIFLKGRSVLAKGYIDSGNLLRDPISQKPASVVEEQVFLQLFSEEEREKMHESFLFCGYTGLYTRRRRALPYKSVGKERGLLSGFIADRMDVQIEGKQITVNRPLLAVYCGNLSMGGQGRGQEDFHIILPERL